MAPTTPRPPQCVQCSAHLSFHPLGLPPRVKYGKEGLDPALRAVVAGLANQQAGAG